MGEKKYKLDDELIRQAFIDAANQEWEEYEAMVGSQEEGSKTHQRRMERLIRSRRRSWWKYVNTAGKRAAVILLTVLILCSGAMSVKAIREPVIRAIIYVYETFTSLFFESDEAPETATFQPYTLNTVPEGYVETERIDTLAMIVTVWDNKENRYIRLQQASVEKYKTLVDSENQTMVAHMVRGIPLYIQVSNNTESWNWAEDDSVFHFTFPIELHEEFMDQMEQGTLLKATEN